jgi:phospholipid transport system substrate-binding protein
MITKATLSLLRTGAVGAAVAFVLVAAAPALANKACEDFIQERAGRVMDILNSSSPEAQKKADLGALFDESVDIESISLYTLGEYGPHATKDELSRYFAALRNYVFVNYVSPAAGFSGVTLSVTGSTDLGGTKGCVVQTLAKTSLPEPTELNWHVARDLSIVDVEIAGVSAARILQAQVIAVLKLNGGNITAATGLLEDLTGKV